VEELEMLKDASLIQEWIQEGEARGEARGRDAAAREMLLGVLQQRFGPIPHAVVARVDERTAGWCHDALSVALSANSIDEWLLQIRDQPV
jgi:hypothetical protein